MFPEYRTGLERQLDEQNAILKAAEALVAAGGTAEQQALALRARKMAHGRASVARARLVQARGR